MKGKTLEELYGLEKSKEIKEKMKLKIIDYVPWNKGLKNIYSKETLNKMSQSRKKLFAQGFVNPMLGKIITKNTRDKMSESRKKLYAEGFSHPMLGKTGWNKGLEFRRGIPRHSYNESFKNKLRVPRHSYDKNFRNKLSESKKRLFAEGKLVNPFLGKKHSEETKKKMRKPKSEEGRKNIKESRIKLWFGPRRAELIKKCSESQKGLNVGDKNPAWLGGKSFEPYCPKFNNEFKNLVRLRDNFCCLNCGVSEQKCIILTNRKLATHHIDYDKKNTCLQNCCALCDSCHMKANKNRELWTEYYHDLLSKRYGYNYNQVSLLNTNS